MGQAAVGVGAPKAQPMNQEKTKSRQKSTKFTPIELQKTAL
jgi:hypothetical protein